MFLGCMFRADQTGTSAEQQCWFWFLPAFPVHTCGVDYFLVLWMDSCMPTWDDGHLSSIWKWFLSKQSSLCLVWWTSGQQHFRLDLHVHSCTRMPIEYRLLEFHVVTHHSYRTDANYLPFSSNHFLFFTWWRKCLDARCYTFICIVILYDCTLCRFVNFGLNKTQPFIFWFHWSND